MSGEGIVAPSLPEAPVSYNERNEAEFRGELQRWATEVDGALQRVIADTATDISAITQGLTLIEEQTPSAAASADFTTGIDSTYDEYILSLLNVIPATDAVDAWVRTSTDGGSTFDSGASNYRWANMAYTNAAISNSATGDTKLEIHGNTDIGSAANELGLCGQVRLYLPSAATYTRLEWETSHINSSGVMATSQGAGERLSAADVDAIQVLFSSGNIESGTIRLYGVTKT